MRPEIITATCIKYRGVHLFLRGSRWHWTIANQSFSNESIDGAQGSIDLYLDREDEPC